MAEQRFRDRIDGGRRLAAELSAYGGRDDVVVLALPRGGVPVAAEVARALGAPLDVFLVRKLGVPGREELAMGAIASGGVRVINEDVVWRYGVTDEDLARVAADEQNEIERQERAYRRGRPDLALAGKTVILVDDGMATGATMRAAATALQAEDPARLVIAVPVAPGATCGSFGDLADQVVCPIAPDALSAVGDGYETFEDLTDDQVRELLGQVVPEG